MSQRSVIPQKEAFLLPPFDWFEFANERTTLTESGIFDHVVIQMQGEYVIKRDVQLQAPPQVDQPFGWQPTSPTTLCRQSSNYELVEYRKANGMLHHQTNGGSVGGMDFTDLNGQTIFMSFLDHLGPVSMYEEL